MSRLATAINTVLWSNVLIYILLAAGIFFTISLGFAQIRHLPKMFKLLFDSKASDKGMSAFQALSLAISGRVGTGNIVGVATAIYFGGPGSVFWMWVLAFLGSATTFAEGALAQLYKEEIHGEYRGGPAFYITKGIKIKGLGKILGILFAVAALIAQAVLMTGIHANAISSSLEQAFHIPAVATAIGVALLLALIIFGGAKRIAKTAEILVPVMSVLYIVVALVIMAVNISKLPAVFSLIMTCAFGTNSMLGGMVGSAIAWGVKRGIYSNEAGMGTAPHPSAAAETSHPAKQGLLQSLSVYIDTMIVCTCTALIILLTDSYNVTDGTSHIVNHLGESVEYGVAYASAAVNTIMPFGAQFVAVCLFLFAFTTIMAQYYNGETNMKYFLNERNDKVFVLVLRLAFVVSVFSGGIYTADTAWAWGDVGAAIMIYANVIGMVFLCMTPRKLLKDYERQLRERKAPVFHPRDIGVTNAPIWDKINKLQKVSKGGLG